MTRGARGGGRHRLPPPRPGVAHLFADWLSTVALSLVLLLAVATGTMALLGFRALTIDSGSMAPTLETGDLVISQSVTGAQLRTGDVVTYDNQALGARVTHRVMSITGDGGRLRVETRGDANSASEVWTTDPAATLGRVAFSIPGAGVLMAGTGARMLRVAVIVLLGLGFLVFSVRRLLRTPVTRRHRVARQVALAPAGAPR